MLAIGTQAPNFSLSDHNGNTVSLEQFSGKTVVIWFYPKADTPGWTIQGCGFRDLAANYQEKNAVILGVSFDSQEENRAFAEKFDFNFPLLCDETRSMGLAYGACTSREAQYAGRIGIVIGPNGSVKEFESNASAKTYPMEVLERL